jgi:hypothetical protein
MPARPKPNDPVFDAILDEAARVRPEDVAPDLDDPALLALVDAAVDPWAEGLTTEGREEARRVATVALATHPDIERILEQARAPKEGSSGVRPKRPAARLAEAAARQARRRGAK